MFAIKTTSRCRRTSLLQSAVNSRNVLACFRSANFATRELENIYTQKEKPTVTITGVSGYVGSQTCLAFLKDGGYRVRGTIRGRNSKSSI